MKNTNPARISIIVVIIALFTLAAAAQGPQLMKRTTFKTDRLDFGPGGTVAIVGAPRGSITVEGWANNEIEINAEIKLEAGSETDLAKLAEVTGFMLEESLGRTAIVSIGTHDKKSVKRSKIKLPKNLIGLPFTIDYRIKVPRYCDLQIDGGDGDLAVSNVEGLMKVNFLRSNARFDLVGGGISATFGDGTVDIIVPTRSWRGRFADVSLSSGTMNVYLPSNISSEIDASILRTGKIENVFADLKPRSRNVKFTEKLIVAKAGNGGIPLKFTVGDGTLKLLESPKPQ